MPHIHTNPGEHDHTASAYIIRTDSSDGEFRIMLHRHKKLGVYLQFGGHIEVNETPWQAMKHELLEETGYVLDDLNVLQPIGTLTKLTNAVAHPTPICHNTHAFDDSASHFHTDLGYLLVADHEPHNQLAEGESEDIIMLTEAEILDLPEEEVFSNVKEIVLFCFSAMADDSIWEQVPTTRFDS